MSIISDSCDTRELDILAFRTISEKLYLTEAVYCASTQ